MLLLSANRARQVQLAALWGRRNGAQMPLSILSAQGLNLGCILIRLSLLNVGTLMETLYYFASFMLCQTYMGIAKLHLDKIYCRFIYLCY